MREKYEGQGLERFWHTLLTFALVGMVAMLALAIWGIWAWIK